MNRQPRKSVEAGRSDVERFAMARHSGASANASPRPILVVSVSIATKSPNRREHFFAKARRVRGERLAVAVALAGRVVPSLPAVVTLVRIGAKRLDGDNLQGALKGVRDATALFLGADDADPRIEWTYAQEVTRERRRVSLPSRAGTIPRVRTVAVRGVRIEIRPSDACDEPDPVCMTVATEAEALEAEHAIAGDGWIGDGSDDADGVSTRARRAFGSLLVSDEPIKLQPQHATRRDRRGAICGARDGQIVDTGVTCERCKAIVAKRRAARARAKGKP